MLDTWEDGWRRGEGGGEREGQDVIVVLLFGTGRGSKNVLINLLLCAYLPLEMRARWLCRQFVLEATGGGRPVVGRSRRAEKRLVHCASCAQV